MHCKRIVLVLFLLCAIPAQAAEFAYFTAKVPARWESEFEAASVSFQPQDGSCRVSVVAYGLEALDIVSLAQNMAGWLGAQDTLRVLSPAERGFVVPVKNGRYWITTANNMVLQIGVSSASGEIPAEVAVVLGSIEAHPERPALAGAIAVLRDNFDIEQWLGGDGPAPEGMPVEAASTSPLPDFANYGNREGEIALPPVMNNLPDGWTATTAGQWAVATSADKSMVVALRTYTLATEDMAHDDWTPLEATALELAALLGGSNIRSGEGNMEFRSSAGGFSMGPKQGNTTQLFFYNSDDALYTWMGIQ